jgi:hypothetical protein
VAAGESVVDGWVSQVVSQVLEWSLSSDNGLDEESKHGEHSKTSILDLLDLELSESIWVISKSKWVEWTSWVESVETLSPFEVSLLAVTESLSLSHEDHLASKVAMMDWAWTNEPVSEVVESIIREDGLAPALNQTGCLRSQQLRCSGGALGRCIQGSEHSPTSVDHLELSVRAKVSGSAERPAVSHP